MTKSPFQKQYSDAIERERAMEKLLIEVDEIKTPDGKFMHIPQMREILNIYSQAEEALNVASRSDKKEYLFTHAYCDNCDTIMPVIKEPLQGVSACGAYSAGDIVCKKCYSIIATVFIPDVHLVNKASTRSTQDCSSGE